MSNLSDFYGGGLPRLGEYVSPVSGTLSDLSDVQINTPLSGYTLRYEGGYWVGSKLLYTDLLGTPSIPSQLKNLSDVNPSLSPSNGQIFKYNGTYWDAVTQAAGSLSSLSDVSLSSLSATQALYYNGTNWVNKKLDYTTDIANTPSIPVNNNFSFVGLNDTNDTVVNNGFLRWNSGGTQINYSSTIGVADITGLAAIATSPVINNITGFSVSGPSNNQVLMYNGGSWVNSSVPKTNRIQDSANATYVDVASITDAVVIQAGPTNGNIYLNVASSGVVSIPGSGAAVITSTNGIEITSSSYVSLNSIKYPAADGTNGQLMSTNGAGQISFINPPTAGATHLYNLLDVTISSNVLGHVIVDDGAGNWTSQFLNFDASGDVTNSGLVLSVGSNKITNAKLAQVATATFKGRTTSGTGNVEDLTATQATALLNVMQGDGGSGGVKGLVPAQAAGDATKFLRGDGAWASIGAGGATALSGLSDVLISGLLTTHYLKYNGTKWVNTYINYGDIQGSPSLSPVAISTGGKFINLTDTPGNYGTNGQFVITNGSALTYYTLPSYLLDIVQDTTPQLGGNLDVNGKDIVSVSNGNIRIIPNGTGQITLGSVTWPTTAGTNTYVLKTNGTSATSWAKVAFTELSDAPSTYSGSNNYFVKVNSGATGLTFVADPGYLTSISSQTLDTLSDVNAPSPISGQVLSWSGSAWVASTPASGSRIQDTNNNTFVDVSTNDDVVITAGPDSVTGGNIILTPNTTLNSNASVVIAGSGDSYISSTNNIVITTPANVSIQGIAYPNTDGPANSFMMTDGAGNLTLTLRTVTLRYNMNAGGTDVSLDGSTPLPSGWTDNSAGTSPNVTITHNMGVVPTVTVWRESPLLSFQPMNVASNVSSTDPLNNITLDLSPVANSGKAYVKLMF